MTESSPQPGDNESHDETTEVKAGAQSGPDRDRGTTATDSDQPSDAPTPSGASGSLEDASNQAVEASSGDEEEGGDEEEDDEDEDEDEEEESDEEDEEEEEPKLKYARLTQHLGPVYRNGDATSAFLVAGDKMVRCPNSHTDRLSQLLTRSADYWYPQWQHC